jgi:predicted DNA-binding transcriptional regulator AlpA
MANEEALLISDVQAAALCGCSRSHWHVMRAAGKLPPSVRLGRKVIWRRAEIIAWINAGCPDTRTWEAMKDSAGRRLKVC